MTKVSRNHQTYRSGFSQRNIMASCGVAQKLSSKFINVPKS